MNWSYLKVFGWLIWRNLRKIKKDFFNNVIDALIVPAGFIIISGYILPYMGMPSNYGSFMMASTLMLMCYSSTSWRGASNLITDLEGDKAISYELTLPLPSWLIFFKYSCAYALDAICLNILTVPMGKLLLWNQFSLEHFSLFKFCIMYITVNLFFGCYSVWVASWVDGIAGFSRFWLRYGSQILFFSGYQFSWLILNKALPNFSYINLINPFVYAFEGARAALLGQEGSLNFWVCMGMLWLFIVFFTLMFIRYFKKKLDYV
ncbi:ABC transporter permease [Candidatus Dependentiae bacterium]|nr:ABC transporter permease [Candidatus Dependentiae bacterium]